MDDSTDDPTPGPIDALIAVQRLDAHTIYVAVEKDGQIWEAHLHDDTKDGAVLSPDAFDKLERELRTRIKTGLG